MPEFCLGMGLYLVGRQKIRLPDDPSVMFLCVTGLLLLIYTHAPDPVTVLGFGLLIFIVAGRSRQRRHGVLDSPVLVYLGEISYAAYLVHFLVLFGVRSTLGSLWFYYLVALSFPITQAIAALLHHAIELPCRRLIRNLAGTFDPAGHRRMDVL